MVVGRSLEDVCRAWGRRRDILPLPGYDEDLYQSIEALKQTLGRRRMPLDSFDTYKVSSCDNSRDLEL